MQDKTVVKSARGIDLTNQFIRSIDLAPLIECKKLSFLNLANNLLDSVNLTPLCQLKGLREINLMDNKIHIIDITPLYFCESLELFKYDDFTNCFVLPIAERIPTRCQTLSDLRKDHNVSYGNIVKIHGWGFIYHSMMNLLKAMRPKYWFLAQIGLLEGFGMGELAGYDGNIQLLFEKTTPEMKYNEVRDLLYSTTMELLEKQLDNCGPTFGLDVDRMSTSKASVLIKKIIEVRKQEVDNLTIYTTDKYADAKSIWHTFYGNTVLDKLGFSPYRRSNPFFNDILYTLTGAGLDVTVKKCDKIPEFEPPYSEGITYYLEDIARINHNFI